MHMYMEMEECSARRNLMVWFTPHILGTMHKELLAHTHMTWQLKK